MGDCTYVYEVAAYPEGDCYSFVGIFSTKEKATAAKKEYLKKHPDERGTMFEPEISKIEVDRVQE